MNKIILAGLTFIMVVIFGVCSCSKSSSHKPINVSLLTMRKDSVKFYINGNWKVIKTTGGFNPATNYPTNYYYEFLNNCTKIVSTIDSNIIIDDTLIWAKDFIGGDSINIMSYHEQNVIPIAVIPMKIINDTFIMRDDGSDGFFYYLIKN